MTTAALLRALRACDIRLSLDGDRLVYDAPEGAMTEEVLTLLRQHKQELLTVLTASPLQAAPMPLAPDYPCVVCSRAQRWHDSGIWRCRRCWPPGSLTPQAIPHMLAEPEARDARRGQDCRGWRGLQELRRITVWQASRDATPPTSEAPSLP